MDTQPETYGLDEQKAYRARLHDLRTAQRRADHSYAELQRRAYNWHEAQRERHLMTWRFIVGAMAVGAGALWLPTLTIIAVVSIAGMWAAVGLYALLKGYESHRSYFGWRVRGSRAHIAATRWDLDRWAEQYETDALALNKAAIRAVAAAPGGAWPLAELCPKAKIDDYERAVRNA